MIDIVDALGLIFLLCILVIIIWGIGFRSGGKSVLKDWQKEIDRQHERRINDLCQYCAGTSNSRPNGFLQTARRYGQLWRATRDRI